MNNDELSPIFIAAHLWQSKGWQVIPAQPGSKRLVAGFGIYQNKVESGEKVKFWFQDRNSNLAVVAPPGAVILDFDDLEAYFEFCRRSPDLATSRTESTPRGGRHLFLWTSAPVTRDLVLVPGIEVKQIVLVYPSKVRGKPYGLINPGEILTGNVLEALQAFKASGGDISRSPTVTRGTGHPMVKSGDKKDDPRFLQKLKARWPILVYLNHFEPELYLAGRGRWLRGRCPWHEDNNPSLWIDTERNLWGCHACKAHGDVLNWHAMRLEASIKEAIRDLARNEIEVANV